MVKTTTTDIRAEQDPMNKNHVALWIDEEGSTCSSGYGLTPESARALAQELLDAADKVDSSDDGCCHYGR